MKYYIFRNFTIENFFPPETFSFSGYGDINNIDQKADAFIWFYLLPFKADTEKVIQEITDFYHKIELILTQIPKQKPFFIFTLVRTFHNQWQNSDSVLDSAINELNQKIYDFAVDCPNIKIINFSDFTQRCTRLKLIDWKYYYISQIMINPQLKAGFQQWFLQQVNAIHGIRKKCLVLDLDNTLWGGILGEDGIDGIQLGNTYPGNSFRDFQQHLRQAAQNGVILTACSKNNEEDVIEAWERNPSMILKKKHFAAYKINWQDKASNIMALAQELNIGLDSMVFIDDNPAERELIRQTLPEVSVPDFPAQPYQLPLFFTEIYERYFQIYALTKEDLTKTNQYQANAQRIQFEKKFTTLKDYLASLEMELKIQPANRFNTPRIAQMTQKTNQFNLTTRRYREDEIHSFHAQKHLVLCMAVKDKFGDNGITAAGIIKLDKNKRTAEIDTFLLSCRILGRGIESVFLKFILNKLKTLNYTNIEAAYIPTHKNKQTADFYDKLDFKVSEQSNGAKRYHLELTNNYTIDDFYKVKEMTDEE